MIALKDYIIDKCVTLFNEMVVLEEEDCGDPPKALIIDIGLQDDKLEAGCFSKSELTLRYSEGKIRSMDTGLKNKQEPIDGMFFFEGYAAVCIDHKADCVFISIYLGPRYARGYKYKMGENSQLIVEELLWVS